MLQVLTLITGFALPWLAAFLVVRCAQERSRSAGSTLIALGGSFFLAMAATGLLLRAQNDYFGGFNTQALWWLSAVTALLAAVWLWRARRAGSETITEPAGPASRPTGAALWLCAALLAAIGLHAGLSALELLAQPLFPWDGWTVWAYRAQAWFLQGALVPMVPANLWLAQPEPFTYPMLAHRYPLLPSLIYLWAALNLGTWHDALVNLPVLACALAIAFALAGCLRRAGAGWVATLTAVYLLFSTPLFATHMSLGGYADIWLAGFAGGGMTLLLCGLLQQQRRLLLGGLLLLLAGTMVKVEGSLWLLAALAVGVLAWTPWRRLLWIVIAGALIAMVLLLSDHSVLTLPGLGRFGYREGVIYLPVKGAIALQVFDVRQAYWQNAFVLGSWHLLWPLLVALGACLIAGLTNGALRRLILAFFTVFLGLQVLIFVFTTQGLWALDYTAINRMPLQMLPATLFLLLLGLRAAIGRLALLRDPAVRGRFAIATVASLLLLAAGVTVWQARSVDGAAVPARDISPETIGFMLGGGELQGEQIVVDRYQDGIAVLSSGPVSLDASSLFLLHLQLDYDDEIQSLDQAPAFFWRRSDQQREVSRMTLDGGDLVDLSLSEDWRGDIVEYGFFLVENRGAPVIITDARLEGRNLTYALRRIPRQWLSYTGWTQRSANWNPAGAYDQVLPLMSAVLMLLALIALLSWLLCGRRQFAPIVLLTLLGGWLLMDARWLLERSWQAELSLARLMNLTVEERSADGALGKYFNYLQRIEDDHLDETPMRIALVLDSDEEPYFALKAKYQLLPHAVSVVRGVPRLAQLRSLDYVLYLGDFTDGDPRAIIGESAAQRIQRLQQNDRRQRRWLQVIDEDVQGTLFRVAPPQPRQGASK